MKRKYNFHKDGLGNLTTKDLTAIVEVNTDLVANAAQVLDKEGVKRHKESSTLLVFILMLTVMNTVGVGALLYYLLTGGL